jgi:hypothetical protein
VAHRGLVVLRALAEWRVDERERKSDGWLF